MSSKQQRNKKKLIIAAVAGIFASFILFSTLNNFNHKIEDQKKIINDISVKTAAPKDSNANYPKVFIAKQHIVTGTRISSSMLEEKSIEPAIRPLDAVKDTNETEGLTAAVNIEAGDIITKNKLKNTETGFIDIPPGMRAITIPVESIQGFASYITAGTKIDIISTAKDDSTDIIAQNIKIIAFENSTKPSADVKAPPISEIKAITLQVPANLTARIVEAMTKGKLQIITRNYNDNQIVAAAVKKEKPNYNSSPMPVRMNLPSPPQIPQTSLIPPSQLPMPLGGAGNFPKAPVPVKKNSKSQKKVEFIQASVKSDVMFDN